MYWMSDWELEVLWWRTQPLSLVRYWFYNHYQIVCADIDDKFTSDLKFQIPK